MPRLTDTILARSLFFKKTTSMGGRLVRLFLLGRLRGVVVPVAHLVELPATLFVAAKATVLGGAPGHGVGQAVRFIGLRAFFCRPAWPVSFGKAS